MFAKGFFFTTVVSINRNVQEILNFSKFILKTNKLLRKYSHGSVKEATSNKTVAPKLLPIIWPAEVASVCRQQR